MPAPEANGRELRQVFRRWQDTSAKDDDTLAANVAAIREIASADLDTDPWRDSVAQPRGAIRKQGTND